MNWQSKYMQAIYDKNFAIADEIKTKNIPKKLYKYFPIDMKRKKTLRNLSLWLCNIDKFNDPFDGKAIYTESDKLASNGWPSEKVERAKRIFSNYYVCSFTASGYKNQLLWAYYNNNEGICVEYDVKNSQNIFPVLYEPKRHTATGIVTNFIFNIDKDNPDQTRRGILLKLSNCVKNTCWKIEEEYRYMQFANSEQRTNGKEENLKNCGLEIKAIYLGCRFEMKGNKKILKEIKEKTNCKIYQLKIDEELGFYDFIEDELKL